MILSRTLPAVAMTAALTMIGLSACSSTGTAPAEPSAAAMSTPASPSPAATDLAGRVQAFCDQADNLVAQYQDLSAAGVTADPQAAQEFNAATQELTTEAQDLAAKVTNDPRLGQQLTDCADKAAAAVGG